MCWDRTDCLHPQREGTIESAPRSSNPPIEVEDAGRLLGLMIKKIAEVDALADHIAALICVIHERGFTVEAETLRQALAVWHCFGQMSENGPII